MDDDDVWMTTALVSVVMTPAEWAIVSASLLASERAGIPSAGRLFGLITDAVDRSAEAIT